MTTIGAVWATTCAVSRSHTEWWTVDKDTTGPSRRRRLTTGFPSVSSRTDWINAPSGWPESQRGGPLHLKQGSGSCPELTIGSVQRPGCDEPAVAGSGSRRPTQSRAQKGSE